MKSKASSTMFKQIHLYCLVIFLIISNSSFGQVTPDGILFQAVARDANGNAASGRNIYAKVSILKGTATGTVAYAESFKVVSSDDGIFTIVIGKGTRTAGANGLSSINWDADFYFVNIKIAIEPSLPTPGWTADAEYVDMGTSQLWSVPYALFASRSTVADSAMSISTIVPGSKGGTGVNNNGKTITLAQSLNFKGVGDITITSTGSSNVTLPLTGLLANTQYVSDRIATDTVSLSNRIDALGVSAGNSTALKVNISDTANMLSPYLRKLDTSAMLNPYLRKLDTANLSKRIDVKLDSAQIPGIIAPYLVAVSGVKYTDTAAMLSPYAIKSNTIASIDAEKARALAAELVLTNNVASNTASITTNTANIASNTASITINTANIASNTASITANATAIVAETTRATAAELVLTNNVASNTASITINTTNIASNTASINANATAIAAETTRATAAELVLTNNVASNTASITTNTANIATNTASITINTTNIASNTTSITANAAAIAAETTRATAAELVLTNNVATNTASITINTTNIASNTASITANAAAIAAETTRATAAELLKVNISDTALMLSPYAIRSNTVASINTKVNISDTASMLSPYALASNVSNTAGLKLNISDTASMLSNYYNKTASDDRLNLKVNISDTSTMLSKYYNKTASDAKLNLKVNISDTATMLSPYAIRSNTEASLNLKAPLASPALTGIPTAPTATTGDNTTQIATTAFVNASITNSTTPDATNVLKGKLKLANDLGGTADAPTVETVGGSTASNINAATILANSATASSTANAIVKRDALGNFSAGTITADLLGTSTNVTGIVLGANGGTGINNAGKTITLGGNINTGAAFTTTGTTLSNASDITFKTTAPTDLILPISGTLATLTGNEQLTNKSINGLMPTSLATGFSIAGGTISKTLTVNNNATVSGTNTGDQTINLTGDLTGSGTGSFVTTLSNSGVTAGTYGSATEVPRLTVDAKGRITNVSNTTITGVSPAGSTMSSGKIIVGDVNNTAAIVDMTGDVTIDNTGATTIGADKITTSKILNGNVTYSKIQNVTTGKILGRVSAGNGIVEEIATTGTGDVVRSISPTFTGAPQVPTPLVSSNDNTIANTQFVTRAIGNISASSVSGVLPGTNGGTGVDNTGKTITLGGNLTTSGANNITFTTTGATNVTLPTSGTLATLSDISGGSITSGQISGIIAPANGGTGVANSNTITLGGNLATGAAFTTTGTTALNASAITLKTTAPSTLILPTTGTIATLDGTETLTNKTLTASANTISGLTNANLSGTAGITDANLATISTAGKVLNTATTASSANTANAIVARDASGNFTAGTITASLAGNANTSTKLSTARSIYGNNFDGTANLGQVISSTYGGTGNGYTKFTGPTSSEKVFTLPDANATILTTDALVTTTQGGTGVASATANTFFAGPVSGADAAPSFRALTAADLPSGSGSYIANSTTQQANSSFNISNTGVIGGSLTAGSLIKQGGTSSQFLKADGSVDSRSFATLAGTEALTNKSVNGVTPTAVTTGFTIAGGLTNNKTLTVSSDANVSGINTGDVTLSAGQNYLSISNQVITASPVNLSGSNVTGTLAAARFPALTGDITNTAGEVATTISTNAVTNTKIADNAVTTTKIADNAISSAKIATSAVTLDKIASISVQKLLGNKSSSAAGAPGEIAIGTGLALDPTTGVLSASGSGGTVTGTGTVGQMPFWSTTTGLASTPNFLWDNTNKIVKIGEGVSNADVDGDMPFDAATMPVLSVVGAKNSTTEQTMLRLKRPLLYGSSVPGLADFVLRGGNNTSGLDIRMNNFIGSTAMINVMTLYSPGGYVGINNTTPTEKLDVGGNIRFSGALKPNNSAGTSGQFLTSTGASTAPTWTTISNASTSSTGLLTNTDWNTFNNKFSLPALSSGSILFSNGTTIAQNNSNFYWDNTNSRLGLLTTAPQHTFQIGGETAENLKYGLMDSYFNTLKLGYRATGWAIRASNNSGVATDLLFSYDNGTTKTDRMTIGTTGGISIPGTLSVTGSLTAGTGNLTNLDVNNGKIFYNASANKIGILTSAPTSMFQVGGDGDFDNPLKYDYAGEVGTLKLGYRNKEFRISTNTSSGVLVGLVYSYYNGTTNTESMRIGNDGLVSIGNLSSTSFKLTGGSPSLGKVLTSDANGNASWSTLNAVSSVGAISSTSNANGATINSGVLNLTPASETNGGVITTGPQSIIGMKRFFSPIVVNDNIQLNFSGAPGGGVEFTGDGDIVDNNDGYATIRFTNGLKINNAKGSLGTTTKITLGSDGVIETTGLKLTGGTPGAGKVLVSDANGVASWASNSPASLSGGVAGAIVYQSGTGTTSFSAAGTSGQILTSGGTGAPTWTSVLSIAQGGTGTSTQNFVDLSTNQTIGGTKTFSSDIIRGGARFGLGGGAGGTDGRNIAMGINALSANTTGQWNVALGAYALQTSTTSSNNVAVGNEVMGVSAPGNDNTGVGNRSLYSNTGSNNTAIGSTALNATTTGSNNTALGQGAGAIITTGSNNTFLGKGANADNAARTNATAIGQGATVSADNTIQLGNTSVVAVNTSGAFNAPVYTSTPVALTPGATISWTPMNGLNASVTLNANSTLSFAATPPVGSSGTLIVTQPATGGPFTLTLPTVAGKTNKVLGSSSGITLSTTNNAKDIVSFYYDGSDFYWNVGLGYGLNQTLTSSNLAGGVAGAMPYQTAVGTTGFTAAGTAGQILTSTGTTAPAWITALPISNGGTGSTTQNFVDLTTAQTIGGVKTFSSNIISNSVMIGKGAGQGNDNTAVGANTLGTGTGARNTAIGYGALSNFTGTGFNNNTGVGYSNLSGLTTGYGNTSMGAETMASVGTGGENTVIGNQALRSATSSNNTVLGASAGNTITSGAGNTIIGKGADVSSATLNYATAIGFGAVATADNTMQLGNTSLTNVKTSGTITAGTITYPNTAGTNGYVLTTNGTNTATWAAPTGAISGGTANTIPKYTSATALGASSITDDGTNISFSNKTVAGGSAAVNSASIAAATTAYTLQQSDNGKVINCANTGALTITIPSGLTAGFNCMIVQMAAGSVTISAGASVTIYNRSNYTKTGGQYAIATIVSPSSNVFITGGDMQ